MVPCRRLGQIDRHILVGAGNRAPYAAHASARKPVLDDRQAFHGRLVSLALGAEPYVALPVSDVGGMAYALTGKKTDMGAGMLS